MTEEQFKKLWKLNPNFSNAAHNYTNTKYYIEVKLKNETILPTGEPLTFELLFARYKQFVLHWQRTIGARGEQFVGKKDNLKTLYEYVDERLYESEQREVNPEADPRFKLIFGDVTVENIEISYQNFRNTIQT